MAKAPAVSWTKTYFRDVMGSGELLWNLTQREVRGKYKRTALGQLWSLANPIAAIIVYTFIFSVVFQVPAQVGENSGLNNYALWLVCGLLPWLFFQSTVTQGVRSIVDNASLVQKVYFPRLVLPLSLTGAGLVNWTFEMTVLVIALALFGAFVFPWLPLVLLFMLVLGVFAAGLAMILSIANVFFRDLAYLLTVILQFWFYLTPILYPISLVDNQSAEWGGLLGTPITLADIYRVNPMEPYVAIFRDLLYHNTFPEASSVIAAVSWAVVTFALGLWYFTKTEKRLAELI
jgi:ABC-2 type transport system permease protein